MLLLIKATSLTIPKKSYYQKTEVGHRKYIKGHYKLCNYVSKEILYP